MRILSEAFNSIQKWLIPELEEEIGELSLKQREFVEAVELIRPEEFMKDFRWDGYGRPRDDRLSIFKAFILKTVYNLPTTKVLIEQIHSSGVLRRLCGWERLGEIPSESTFSRAFREFSESGVLDKMHERLVKRYRGEKLCGHISRDSTAIRGREKAVVKSKEDAKERVEKKKRGRPKKGEVRIGKVRRLELQLQRELEENVKELPVQCDWGIKKDSNGKRMIWKGYKLHIDCIDGDIPVSAILTSASVHDSQVAIPLAQKSSRRVTNLYDLMDSAYDAPEIHEFSYSLNHIPLIDHNKRKGTKRKFSPAEAVRYNERSAVERINSNLKENYGGKHIRVRGHQKVFTHLMFGILVITAKQLFHMLL
jgi:hypothetical protein